MERPLTGFHFLVSFELFPQTPFDVRFKEVNGLSMSLNTESVTEGGENRFVHKLPVRSAYSDITLKRGLFVYTELYRWCKNAIEDFDFKPLNLIINLLNEEHVPLYSWRVFNAIPTKWELSAFNAEANEVVVESIVLSYNYFTPMGR